MTTKKFILKTLASIFMVVLLFSFIAREGLVASISLVWVFVAVIVLFILSNGILAVRSAIKESPKNNKVFLFKLISSTALLSVGYSFILASLLSVIVLNIDSVLVFLSIFLSLLLILAIFFAIIILFSHKNQIPVKLRFIKKGILVLAAFFAVVASIAVVLWMQIQNDISSITFVYLLFVIPLIEGVVGVMLTALWICNSSKGIQKKAVKKRK